MVKNLIVIFIGILFAIVAFATKNHIMQKIGIVAMGIALVFATMWLIGTIKERKEKKQ